MTNNLAKVPRAPIMVCLQCPLCCNLVYGATSISECLHTFCRDCIYQRLGDGETDYCPICNVSLGCSPLEKLRADHQLDDICAKVFRLQSQKRKNVDSIAEEPAPLPVRRKERSLYSLGIGAVPSSANPGFVSRRTKSLSRRSVAIRDTSADEFEDGKLRQSSLELGNIEDGKDSSGTDDSTGSLPEADISEVTANVGEKHDSPISGKQDISPGRRKSTCKEGTVQGRKGEQLLTVKRTPLPKRISQDLPSKSDILASSNLGIYLAERSKISATGLCHSQNLGISKNANSFPFKHEKSDPQSCHNLEQPALTSGRRRQRVRKGSRNHSSLAHLAEVAVDNAGDFGSSLFHTVHHHGAATHAVRSCRKRGKSTSVQGTSAGEGCTLHTGNKRARTSTLHLHSRLQPLGRTSTGLDKLPVIRNKGSSTSAGTSGHIVSAPKHHRSQVGLWLSLRAAENQFGDYALPQIATQYLRIKDGKLPISIVKKYLVKKLDLGSESEVELTCRGQPVGPSLPLESIQGIWFATTESSSFPSLKDLDGSLSNNGAWCSVNGSSAEKSVVVLTYGRNHRTILNQ